MEAAAGSVLSTSSSPSTASASLMSFLHSPKTHHFSFISSSNSPRISFPPTNSNSSSFSYGSSNLLKCFRPLSSSWCPRSSNTTTPLTIADNFTVDSTTDAGNSSSKDLLLPKIDKSGRFCSPRAARELALMILYASCLEGSDPLRLFEKRLNARRETGYEFNKASLTEYDHMSFGGPPVTVHTTEEADEILQIDQKESDIEAEVLSAPPKLVYSKLILRFTRKLLAAVVEKWDSNVLAIDKVAPPNWKNEPAVRILELSVLHLAMSEIAVVGTRHQIVINEAVDLAKRFCDGSAPRIINGCLRTFIKDFNGNGEAQQLLKIKQTV